MPKLTDDAKAILLLCGRFGTSAGVKPLSQGQYNRLALWLKKQEMRPADLFEEGIVPRAAQGTGVANEQVSRLLERGAEMAFALESWTRSGLWVQCRCDPEYPARLRTHLKQLAPPILFGSGDRLLLEGGGLAIVGSRNVDEEGQGFTRKVAEWCARGGVPVVSGGARGVDQIAMRSALEAGGKVIGVLADSLLRKSLAKDARRAIAEGRLLLVSPFHPEARFTVGTAMGRNKFIYAMADAGLAVSAEYRKGGTWAGAEEELKRAKSRTVFVRQSADVPKGNKELLGMGARPFCESWLEELPSKVLHERASQTPSSSGAHILPLFASSLKTSATATPNDSPGQTSTPKSSEESRPRTVYRAVLPLILAKLREPASEDELAQRLEVHKGQLRVWLKQAVDENEVKRKTHPVRYVRAGHRN